MSRHNLDIFFHMKNHYKKLEAVKCVVDTGRSRLEQHNSKSSLLKGSRKKKRFIRGNHGRALSDDRPQTRRNLSDVPSSQNNRSQSTKRPINKNDKKKNKQLANRIESSLPDQKDFDKIESDSVNDTGNEKNGNGTITPVPEETTPSVFPKSGTHYVIAEQTSSSITTCMDKVAENKNSTKCINEHEYSQFLLRITEDIIRNECYTMEMILNVFKSHIEANKSHLELDKMLIMIKQLCCEINFPLEIKEIEECDENEQCKICFDFSSCENMNLSCDGEEPEQQEEIIFDKCEFNDALPQNQEENDDETKSMKCLLSEKLRRCVEKEGDTLPKMKTEPEENNTCLKYKNEEKDKECEPEWEWNQRENALPEHYVNQLENCLKRMETFFMQFSQANGQPQTPAICNVPQVPLHYPDKCIKNNLPQRERQFESCNATRSPKKHYCKRCQMRFRQKPCNKSELPTTYPFALSYACNKKLVKNDVDSKEVKFCNMSSAYSSDFNCNEYVDDVVEVIKLPPKAFVDESCVDKNSINFSSSNNTTARDLPLNINKKQCRGIEIQTETVDNTKTTVEEKNQQVQQRAVGIQWGKCCCSSNKCNQTSNIAVGIECSTSKINPKSTDAGTQYAKTERGCPNSSECYKMKKSAKKLPNTVDASVQYEKETDKCKKSKTDIEKNDIEENLNSRKEKLKVCIQSPENNGWNSKIREYKLLLQDLFSKCEDQCSGNYQRDFGNIPQKDVKENMETNFNGCKRISENGTMSDKGYYKINEYKSMLQDLFQRCNNITQDQPPMGKVHQATNATPPKLLLDNYEFKACQKSTVPTKSYCTLKTTKDEIFISPAYENWSVNSKDLKFTREAAHQHPQIQDDFHVTVMHDAFTAMPSKQLFTSPYCNSANRFCDKRENFLLDNTYEKNKYKENTLLPLTLATFFPSAETQTTDIDRQLATQLIMTVQTPTKEEIPIRKENYNIPQNEEMSQTENEVQKPVEEPPKPQRKTSMKPENKDRKKHPTPANRMVSVGNIEEVPFTFENDIKGYQSEPLPVENDPENKDNLDPESSEGAKNFEEDLKENKDDSEEIEIENIEEQNWNEEDINMPDSSASPKPIVESNNKETEQTEKQDESILSDESEYNCCGRKKIYSSEMSRNDRSSTRGSMWGVDKQPPATDASAIHKNVEMQQLIRDVNKQQELLKKGDKRWMDRNIDIESIKKRFDRRSSSINSDELRIEQTVRKTLAEKSGKERTRAKSHYVDEENLELIRTRSKKRNTLMVLEDQVSNDS